MYKFFNNVKIAFHTIFFLVFLFSYLVAKGQTDKSLSIYYGFGQTSLTAVQEVVLDSLFNSLNNKNIEITISSYADSIGTTKSNLEISEKRGNYLKKYIIKKYKIEESKISVLPKGEESPTYSNKTAYYRSKNRRSDILVTIIENNLSVENDLLNTIEKSIQNEKDTIAIQLEKNKLSNYIPLSCDDTTYLRDTIIFLQDGLVLDTKYCPFDDEKIVVDIRVYTFNTVNEVISNNLFTYAEQQRELMSFGMFCLDVNAYKINDNALITLLIPASNLLRNSSFLSENKPPCNIRLFLNNGNSWLITNAIILKPILKDGIWYYEFKGTKRELEILSCPNKINFDCYMSASNKKKGMIIKVKQKNIIDIYINVFAPNWFRVVNAIKKKPKNNPKKFYFNSIYDSYYTSDTAKLYIKLSNSVDLISKELFNRKDTLKTKYYKNRLFKKHGTINVNVIKKHRTYIISKYIRRVKIRNKDIIN